jgi:hypothetical protein
VNSPLEIVKPHDDAKLLIIIGDESAGWAGQIYPMAIVRSLQSG